LLAVLNEASSDIFRVVKVDDLEAWQSVRQAVEGTLSAINLTGNQWSFDVGAGSELSEKLSKIPTKLGEIAHLFVGLQTDGDDVFILEEIEKNGERVLCQSKATGSQHWFENDHLKPF
jgi:hypothetical protein